jgi:hypothetical protein
VLQAGTGSTIRFAGSRSNQSHWAIDGITFSDGVDETQIGPLANYIESYQEIKVDIANNTAEFGTIGQVTLISKSGTNEFRGNLFDYYSTPWFRARNPFAPARATGVSHTPGGSVGGPVFLPKLYNGKDKTFLFFSFETGRGSPNTVLLNPTVPLASWRTGDFSALGTPIRDPLSGAPFPGNRIPANRLNQTALKLQERYYPLPNFGDTSTLIAQNYRENKDPAFRAVRLLDLTRRSPVQRKELDLQPVHSAGRITARVAKQSADRWPAFPTSLQSRIYVFLYAQLCADDDQRSTLRFRV